MKADLREKYRTVIQELDWLSDYGYYADRIDASMNGDLSCSLYREADSGCITAANVAIALMQAVLFKAEEDGILSLNGFRLEENGIKPFSDCYEQARHLQFGFINNELEKYGYYFPEGYNYSGSLFEYHDCTACLEDMAEDVLRFEYKNILCENDIPEDKEGLIQALNEAWYEGSNPIFCIANRKWHDIQKRYNRLASEYAALLQSDYQAVQHRINSVCSIDDVMCDCDDFTDADGNTLLVNFLYDGTLCFSDGAIEEPETPLLTHLSLTDIVFDLQETDRMMNALFNRIKQCEKGANIWREEKKP